MTGPFPRSRKGSRSCPHQPPTPTRRGVLTGAAALAAAGYVADPAAAQGRRPRHRSRHLRLTILGTTDLHGNVFNWDYYKNAEYDDAAHNDIGIAKVQTLIKAQRGRVARANRC